MSKPAWHRHKNLRCGECRAIVYPNVVCAMRGAPRMCPIPKLVRCPEHRPKGKQ
jgi:hypothetical protein